MRWYLAGTPLATWSSTTRLCIDLRQQFDVFDDRPVRRRALQGHENGFIQAHVLHVVRTFGFIRAHPPVMMRQASLSDSGRL